MYGRTTFFLYGPEAVQNGSFCTIRIKADILLPALFFRFLSIKFFYPLIIRAVYDF